ncbi:hypothetical protein RSAG8_08888, partial [Rhizoctonia solani AG-8 WAC10335]
MLKPANRQPGILEYMKGIVTLSVIFVSSAGVSVLLNGVSSLIEIVPLHPFAFFIGFDFDALPCSV